MITAYHRGCRDTALFPKHLHHRDQCPGRPCTLPCRHCCHRRQNSRCTHSRGPNRQDRLENSNIKFNEKTEHQKITSQLFVRPLLQAAKNLLVSSFLWNTNPFLLRVTTGLPDCGSNGTSPFITGDQSSKVYWPLFRVASVQNVWDFF